MYSLFSFKKDDCVGLGVAYNLTIRITLQRQRYHLLIRNKGHAPYYIIYYKSCSLLFCVTGHVK